MKATLPVLDQNGKNGGESVPYGHQDTASWQAFINWMVQQGVLGTSQRAVDALTNELLPTRQIDVGN